MTTNSLFFRLVFLFLYCSPTLLWAQIPDSLNNRSLEDLNTDLIEDYIAAGEGDEDFDFNALYEDLEHYRTHPLDINKIGRTELEGLRLLSDLQVNDFLNYRKNCGDFIALQELQAIPSFSMEVINRFLPYVKLGGGLDDFKVSIPKMLAQGDNELFMRWRRILEPQEGFLRDPATNTNLFLGDRNKYYVRYRHRYSTRLSYGFTAEKDEGESFFSGSNANGFDFYSAHLYLRDYNKVIKTVALGDFQASFGQGLILFSGFGSRKGSMVMNIKRHSRTLSSYRSVDENRFLRGAGVTLGLAKGLEATIFASSRQRDANLILLLADTLSEETDQVIASSLLGSGLHRTPSEVAKEKDIRQRTLGASLKYATNQWHVAANALWEDLDRPLEPSDSPYNQFFFTGNRLFNTSLDYSFLYRNYNLFGETAISDNGGFATTNGLLLGLDRNLDLSVLYRWFGRDYQALNPNPLAETRGARNERGLYLGMEYRFAKNWRLSGYYDLYEHPWLRFQVDAPSRGVDYRIRLTYYQKRKLETYIEVRNETKQSNSSIDPFNTNELVDQQNFQLRLHLTQNISKTFRLSNRVDFGFARLGSSERLTGFLAYQDIAWRSLNWPISITSRLAIFDTDGYAVRFYHYENDLIYNFSIPAYYNRGSRFYVNFRYTGIRNLSLEARFARTHWSDQEEFGSGLNAIAGQNRSEVKVQVKWNF